MTDPSLVESYASKFLLFIFYHLSSAFSLSGTFKEFLYSIFILSAW